MSTPALIVMLAAGLFITRLWIAKPAVAKDNMDAFRASLEHDPALGTTLLEFASRERRLTIVVYTSLCACDSDELGRIAFPTTADHRTLIVVPSPKEAIEGTPELLPYRDMFVFDGDYSLKKRLNSSFLPRVYAFDRSGRLIWKSQTWASEWSTLREDAIEEIGNR